MAGALRPVVILMLLASALFVAAGLLDGVYPGGAGWPPADLAAVSYVFALVNTFVAILVARGSEKSLALRMGLSLFFVFERPVSAFVVGSKSTPSIAVHLATAFVELVILVSAIRVWRLGHSVASGELDELLALDGQAPAVPGPSAESDDPSSDRPATKISARAAWLIAITTLLLAVLLVADGLVSGYMPGGRQWGLSGESSGWLVYLFAVVVLAVATRAVQGDRIALRLLTALALIFFVERAFSPFALRVFDPLALGLHAIAAFASLAVALASANALREQRSKPEGDVPSLEAA